MRVRTRAAVTVALVLTALASGLAGCGRKGPTHAPEGEESAYTYPRFYPARDPKEPMAEDSSAEENDLLEEDLADERVPLPPLSPSRRSTTTYGPVPP